MSDVNENTGPPLLTQDQRTQLMIELSDAVKQTGEAVLKLPGGEIYNTIEVARHQFSTLDAAGSNILRSALTNSVRFHNGTIIEEAEASQWLQPDRQLQYPLFITDAVEGSVNAKRGLTSLLPRPIHAGTSAMVLETPYLYSIAASAFFDFASGNTFASVRGERGSFLPFVNGQLIRQRLVSSPNDDSQRYIVVPGYSNSNIDARSAVEKVLVQAGLSTTGGSRSSAQDLLDIIGHQVDGYVDLRALFSHSPDNRDEVLHSWDVGGILPVLNGLGLCIITIDEDGNKDWQEQSFARPLALVVAWPEVIKTVVKCLYSLPFLHHTGDLCATILCWYPDIGQPHRHSALWKS